MSVPNHRKAVPKSHRVSSNRAQKHTAQLHPLTSFSREPADGESRLERVATQILKRPVELYHLRADLLDKLHSVPYSQSIDPNRRKDTFYDKMTKAGALRVFLHASTLKGISQWLLLREIVRTDRDLESDNLSSEGYPLRFHNRLVSEFSRHENALTKILSKHKVNEQWLSRYFLAINEEKMRQLRLVCYSRFPGSRELLLGPHRNEDLLTEIGIFDLLKQRFKKPLPVRLLRRLSVLICSPPNSKEVSVEQEEALRKSLARRR